MSEKFEKHAFHYLKVLIVLLSIILITLVLGVGQEFSSLKISNDGHILQTSAINFSARA